MNPQDEPKVVSEDLFRMQLNVVEKLATAVSENSTATRGIAEVQAQQGRLLERLDDRSESSRKEAVLDIKDHITGAASNLEKHITVTVDRVGDALANKLEFYNKPQFWFAIAILAASAIAGNLLKGIGLIK